MPNMSYCRFRNTLNDLRDCYENMDEKLSPEEQEARNALIALCTNISNDYDSEDDD